MKNKINFKNSILFKVNSITIVILILFITGLGVMINHSMSQEIDKLITNRNLEAAKSLQNQADAFFSKAENTIQLISRRSDIKNLNKAEIKQIFKGIKQNQKFRALYLGTVKGDFIVYPQVNTPEGYDPRDRPWYQKTKSQDQLRWIDPYLEPSTKKPMITVAVPIKQDGKLVGVLGGDIYLETLSKKVVNKKIGNTGYAYLINDNGQLLAHPDQEKVKSQFNAKKVFDVESILKQNEGTMQYTFNGQDKFASFVKVNRIGGAIITQAPLKEIYSARNGIRNQIILFSLVVIVLLSLFIYFINKKYILTPLNKLINTILSIADGDLNDKIQFEDRNDEIGQVGTALSKMKQNLKEIIVNLKNSIEDLSAYSEELSASAEEGNATIETTNQLIENMSASIQQISASAQEVNSFAQEATSQTQGGTENIKATINNIETIDQSVDKTVNIMGELNDKSQEIEQIIELITNIAEQTNLLALNAAIEAARAGTNKNSEGGQGFAVVAEEIRELAEETSQATNEIAQLIAEIQKKANAGLNAINEVQDKTQTGKEISQETGEVFDKIKTYNQQTSNQIQQTSAAAQELAENSDEIMTAADDIDNMSEEVTKSSQELAEMAQKLQQVIQRFDV